MSDFAGNNVEAKGDPQNLRIAVFCVGNRLHQDDGIGPVVYDQVMERFDVPENVTLIDAGVMTMDFITMVDTCDVLIAVDAVEDSGKPAGTVLRYTVDDVVHPEGYVMSLHDMKLVDLFDAAVMLGYEAEGICLGMQVVDVDPQFLTDELSEPVAAAIPLLVDTLAAELARLGSPLLKKGTGEPYLGPEA